MQTCFAYNCKSFFCKSFFSKISPLSLLKTHPLNTSPSLDPSSSWSPCSGPCPARHAPSSWTPNAPPTLDPLLFIFICHHMETAAARTFSVLGRSIPPLFSLSVPPERSDRDQISNWGSETCRKEENKKQEKRRRIWGQPKFLSLVMHLPNGQWAHALASRTFLSPYFT